MPGCFGNSGEDKKRFLNGGIVDNKSLMLIGNKINER